LRHRLLRIPPRETTFEVRRFHEGRPDARIELERHGESFVSGFNLALLASGAEEFERRICLVPLEERGFAYEGAAMALAILDLLVPADPLRVQKLMEGAGSRYVYTIHVGIGWALARLRRRPWGRFRSLDHLLRWLAIDGYGFHEAFFKPERTVRAQLRPRRLGGYALRVFDQGVGRSIWFVDGADVKQVLTTVAAFSPDRRPDLLSGVGLAAAYAGGAPPADLEMLLEGAGPLRPALAQGAAFAAQARVRGQNMVPHTETACRVFCEMGALEAALETNLALDRIDEQRFCPAPGFHEHLPAYERWRTAIQARFGGSPTDSAEGGRQ
jgi:hypothetical protein